MQGEILENMIGTLVRHSLTADELFPLIQGLPETSAIPQSRLEYELRILKILSMGWGLSYYLDEGEVKEKIVTGFWKEIFLFSGELDQVAGATGLNLSYFSLLQERFTAYLARVEALPLKDIIKIMGLACADFCGDENDSYIFVVAKKVFADTLTTLQTYLGEFGMPFDNSIRNRMDRQDL